MTRTLVISTGIALLVGLALLLGPSATASSHATVTTRQPDSTAQKGKTRPTTPPGNDDQPGLPGFPVLPDAVDPALYRALVDQMNAGPDQQLLDNQNTNQRNALTPPPPPALPQQFTHSTSPCRDFGDTLHHSAAQLIPGGGLVTNLLQHLCLLGSP